VWVESIACLEGVKHAIMLVDTCLLVEGHCAALIKKLSTNKRDKSRTASLVLDI
jgi:hypothetical protein